MPSRTPAFILIINEHAEEIKLATISFRGFFPDCRIDVAYSAEDARTLVAAQQAEWSLILVDDGCLSENDPAFINDLKLHARYAAVILQSDRSDSESAIRALQAGADFFLAKQSPAFLIELLFCAREALDKRELRLTAEHAAIRHHQLLESLNDVSYELDGDGRFLSLSPHVISLLGYEPDELVGSSYTRVFSPEHEPAAKYRFNERRSGSRSARHLLLTLQRKPTTDGLPLLITVEVSARGLYDAHRRFIGTVGVIRDISTITRQETADLRSQRQAVQTEEFRALIRHVRSLTHSLQQPLSALLAQVQELLAASREARVHERIEQLADQIAGVSDLGDRLARTMEQAPRPDQRETLNDLLAELIQTKAHDSGLTGVSVEYAPSLPAYHGNPEQTLDFFRLLLRYARAYLDAVGRPHTLTIRVGGVGLPASLDSPVLFPLTPPTEFEVTVMETDQDVSAPTPAVPDESVDLLRLVRLVGALGGTLDVSAASSAPFRMVVRLPAGTQPPSLSPTVSQPERPVPPVVSEPIPAISPTRISQIEAPTEERRTSQRVATVLPAHITLDSTSWEGTVANLSQGGACLTLPAGFPSIVEQDVYVVLRTAAGILEINGTARLRNPTADAARSAALNTIIVITFDALQPTEGAILSSLIDAARDQSVSFSLDMLLAFDPKSSQTTDDSLSAQPSEQERRESVRVNLTLPVRLETPGHSEPAARLIAQITDISRDGAGLIVKADPLQLRNPVILHFASARTGGVAGSHEPGAPDSALPAEVVRSVADSTASEEFLPQGSSHAARIGVRFVSLTPFAERELTRLIRQHLASPQLSAEAAERNFISSVHRECRNPRGQTIAIMDDHSIRPLASETPILVIAPGFGQTASDYCALSYYMAHHQLRVLRYDHTNHIGLSDGELQNTALRSMQADLSKVLDYVSHTWPTAPIVLLATDFSARVALKAAAQGRPLELILLVNPVVDAGALMMTVHGHDLIADHRYGLRRGIINLFGLNLNLDQFIGDMVAGRFTDLPSTLEDLRLLRAPLSIVTSPGEGSSLPPPDLPHGFISALGPQARMMTLPTTLSDYGQFSSETPPAAFRRILEHIAAAVGFTIPPLEFTAESVYSLARRRRLEMEHTRLHHNISQISREALAVALVQQLPHLANVHEYRKLLDDLYAFLGSLTPGTTVLDAGIGQSDLSRALLINHTYRARQRGQLLVHLPSLIGIRRSIDTLSQAKKNVLALQRELITGGTGGTSAAPVLSLGWVQGDWSQSLPFQSRSVHRIVSNLSLPFATSVRATLSEWSRVLHPEGRLVFTTFHSRTDVSTLYRHHLRLANQDEFSAQAQPVLHFLGRLRESIRHGILHTFDYPALASLLRQSGHTSFKISQVFGGQVFVVVVGKGISSSSGS